MTASAIGRDPAREVVAAARFLSTPAEQRIRPFDPTLAISEDRRREIVSERRRRLGALELRFQLRQTG
jgi:hypothetical protein